MVNLWIWGKETAAEAAARCRFGIAVRPVWRRRLGWWSAVEPDQINTDVTDLVKAHHLSWSCDQEIYRWGLDDRNWKPLSPKTALDRLAELGDKGGV
jgi:hypothetical protein